MKLFDFVFQIIIILLLGGAGILLFMLLCFEWLPAIALIFYFIGPTVLLLVIFSCVHIIDDLIKEANK